MATLDTDTAARQVEALDNSSKLVKDGSVVSGNVLHAHAVHTVATADATSDTLRIVRIPAGSWLLPDECKVVHEAGGTAYTLTVGDGTDPDRFSAALDVKAAGTTAFAGGVEALAPVKISEDIWLTATLTSVTTPTDGNVMKYSIAYKAIA